MTVKELIDVLKKYPQHMDVLIYTPSPDDHYKVNGVDVVEDHYEDENKKAVYLDVERLD